MRKLKVFQILLVVIFLLFLIFLFLPKNYTKKYSLNNVEITESYDKTRHSYYFTFKYQNVYLDMLFNSKYKNNRKFIEDLKIVSDNNDFCLIPSGKTFQFYPVCYENNSVVHYSLITNLKDLLPSTLYNKPKLLKTYKDIDIYNQNYNYYLWNYDGFYHINSKETKKIDLFEKEEYTINLIGYTKDYLVIADYDSNYTFNNYYTITLKNGKLKKHSLDRSIYFDSYFPGYLKNKLYIVDSKEKTMYELNVKNGDLEKIKAKVLTNNTWKNANINTIIKEKPKFTYNSLFNYSLEENNLYLTYFKKDIPTLISTNVKSIIRIKDSDIFYLKEDDLYHFNPYTGEELLLTYFEWNFNYNNMIFID